MLVLRIVLAITLFSLVVTLVRFIFVLDAAVDLVFSSGFVRSVNLKTGDVEIDANRSGSVFLVAADTIVFVASKTRPRWFRKKIRGFVVKTTVDGVSARAVQ